MIELRPWKFNNFRKSRCLKNWIRNRIRNTTKSFPRCSRQSLTDFWRSRERRDDRVMEKRWEGEGGEFAWNWGAEKQKLRESVANRSRNRRIAKAACVHFNCTIASRRYSPMNGEGGQRRGSVEKKRARNTETGRMGQTGERRNKGMRGRASRSPRSHQPDRTTDRWMWMQLFNWGNGTWHV